MNKKKKGILRVVAMMMAMVIITKSSIIGKAAEGENSSIALFSTERQMSVSLSKSGNTATITARMIGATSITKVQITMYLQKKTTTGEWKTVRSWSTSKAGYYCQMKKSCSVSKGIYRVKMVTTCYKGKTKEVSTRISATKTF